MMTTNTNLEKIQQLLESLEFDYSHENIHLPDDAPSIIFVLVCRVDSFNRLTRFFGTGFCSMVDLDV